MKNKIRLFNSGALDETGTGVDSESQLDRKAMLVYCGDFESAEGPVTIAEEHIERLAAKYNSRFAKLKRLMNGEVAMKECPPIQLDHSTSARDTVGRLVGDLTIGEHTTADGETRKALFGTVRFLGKENVEKAKDGRWTHLSIGADIEQGDLSELTVTPFPAAPEASLLSKTNLSEVVETPAPEPIAEVTATKFAVGDKVKSNVEAFGGMLPAGSMSEVEVVGDGNIMPEKHVKVRGGDIPHGWVYHEDHLEKHHVENEGDPMDKEKLKKYLTEEKKMSEEDAVKCMSEMDDEKMSKMAAEVAEHEKKMAAEAGKPEDDKKEKEEKMAAAKKQIIQLAKDFRKSQGSVQLEARKMRINSRLTKLRSAARITPAEIKKIDITKLANANDATIEAVFKTYEDREPVIMTGVFSTNRAVNIAAHSKKIELQKLEDETRRNMSSVAQPEEKKMAGEGEKEVNIHVDQTPHTDVGELYEHMKKMMAEGKEDEAKEHLKKHMAYAAHYAMGNETSAPTDEHMDAVEKGMSTMSKQFDDMIKLVGGGLQIESNDLQ